MPKGGAIDLSKCYVGALCKRGHEHEDTGGSLRRTDSRSCVACTRARGAQWRAANQEATKAHNDKPKNRAARKALGRCPGTYQLDHIRPLASFDLADSEQVREAFAPENHQWLMQEDHVAKSAAESGRRV